MRTAWFACLCLALCSWAQPVDPKFAALANQLFQASDDAARESLLASRKDLLTPDLVKAMNELAGQVFDRREYSESLKMYNTACTVAMRIGDQHGQAACTFDAGLSQSRLQRQEEAIALYHRSIPMYQAISDHAGAVAVFNALGVMYHRRGELQESVSYFLQAMEEAEFSGSDVAVAQTNTNLGNVYKDLGNLRAAVQSLEKALEVTRRHHMDQQSAWIMNNLGGVYFQQSDTELALSYHLQSLALKEKLKDAAPTDLASTLLNIGLDYESLDNFPKAAATYDRVLELASTSDTLPYHALTLYNYGELMRRQGQLTAAKEKLNTALTEAEKAQDRSTAANCRITLGEIAVDETRYTQALQLAEEALAVVRPSGEALAIERGEEVRGAALQQLGRVDEAEAAFLASLRMIDDQRLHLPGDQRSSANFLNDHLSVYRRLADLEIGRNRPEMALSYIERAKGRVLFEVLSNGRADVTKAMTGEERRREIALNHSVSRLNEQMLQESRRETPDRRHMTDLAGQLEHARNEYRSFEIALYAEHPQLKVQRLDFEPATPSDLVAALPDGDAALLEYSITDRGTFLYVITRGAGHPARPELRLYNLELKKDSLRRDVARFREQIATRDLDYRKLALALYRQLVAPATEQLRGKSTLVIVPDGMLWQLPFQALESAPDHYLLQDRAIFYTPSLSVLHEMGKLKLARGASQPRLLAVEAALLPSAQREVDGLRQLYGPGRIKIFGAADADEDRIKREAPNYQMLHLAAHGVFEDRNPMNSYLVLAKAGKPEAGVLEARAMMGLELRADLVVLSGCETGRSNGGAGEGLLGMSWALFVAGSPTTVASQWKVDSDSTSQLMVDFHRNLRTSSKAKALQQASLEVMRKPEYRHPFYWSGFVLMGEGF